MDFINNHRGPRWLCIKLFDNLTKHVQVFICFRQPWVSRNSCTRWVPGCNVTNEGFSLQTIAVCRTGPSFMMSLPEPPSGAEPSCTNLLSSGCNITTVTSFLGPYWMEYFLLTQGASSTSQTTLPKNVSPRFFNLIFVKWGSNFFFGECI